MPWSSYVITAVSNAWSHAEVGDSETVDEVVAGVRNADDATRASIICARCTSLHRKHANASRGRGWLTLVIIATLPVVAVSLTDDIRRSTTAVVDLGSVMHTVDPRFVSYVLDPGSFEIGHIFSTYPYPVNLSSTLFRRFAAALAPSLFVINGGSNNCFQYEGFEAFGPSHLASNSTKYMSAYCKRKGALWGMTLKPGLPAAACGPYCLPFSSAPAAN